MQKQNNTEVIYLRLSKELKKKIKRFARETGDSEVGAVRRIVSDFLTITTRKV